MQVIYLKKRVETYNAHIANFNVVQQEASLTINQDTKKANRTSANNAIKNFVTNII